MNKKNKIGADKIISVYWFVILFIVAGAIVYMVAVFYGNPFDVREFEAGIMINKVADCISENGKLKYELTEELKENFMDECKLNFETEFESAGEYYLEVGFYEFEIYPNNPLNFTIVEGNINLKNTYLDTRGETNSIAYSMKSFYVLQTEGENQNELVIEILSIVGKEGKNVK
ncbi:hypothetical protein J4407_01850 [Candidatus Pacearchaeota archaeon]|nr:hypothetical protein [Candidatus Pacearchaeota archaeon]